MAFGKYSAMSLKLARERRDHARKQLARGNDPGELKKANEERSRETFEAIAREWFGRFSANWAHSHSDKVIRRFEMNLFLGIGARPIRLITPPELLPCLRRIEARGSLDMAHRAHQIALAELLAKHS